MPELNDIKINLGELRKHLAALQSDGFEEIGLEYLLQYIKAWKRAETPTSNFVSPLRAYSPQEIAGIHASLAPQYCFIRNCSLPQHQERR